MQQAGLRNVAFDRGLSFARGLVSAEPATASLIRKMVNFATINQRPGQVVAAAGAAGTKHAIVHAAEQRQRSNQSTMTMRAGSENRHRNL